MIDTNSIGPNSMSIMLWKRLFEFDYAITLDVEPKRYEVLKVYMTKKVEKAYENKGTNNHTKT